MDNRTKNILIAVVAVLGVGLLLVAGVIVAFVMWLGSPTPLLDSARLLGPETVGYATLRLEPENLETVGFLEALEADYSASAQPGEWPFGMTPRANFDGLLPSQVAWTMFRDPGGRDDLHVASISLPRLGRLVSLVGMIRSFVRGDAGERIVPIDNPVRAAYFERSGTVFVTSSTEAARRALDLLDVDEAARAPREPTALEELFAETDSAHPFHGAIENSDEGLSRVLERLSAMLDREDTPQTLDLSDVAGVYFSGALTSAGAFGGQVTAVAASGAWSDVEAQAVAAALGQLQPEDLRGAELQVDVRAAGPRLEIDFRIPNMTEVLSPPLGAPRLGERPPRR